MRCSSLRRPLVLEHLDRRLLLAGDCDVALDADGDLTVHCDKEDNFVSISTDFLTGNLLVEGRFDTAINGVVNDTIDFGVVELDDIDVRMRGGNDTLLLSSLEADDVFASLGKGNDEVIAAFVTAADDFVIRGNAGNENIGLLQITAGNRIRVNGGKGDDFVSGNFVEAQKLRLKGGNGTDTLDLGVVVGNVVATEFEVESGGGGGPLPPPLPPLA